jgi:hypothetical protein
MDSTASLNALIPIGSSQKIQSDEPNEYSLTQETEDPSFESVSIRDESIDQRSTDIDLNDSPLNLNIHTPQNMYTQSSRAHSLGRSSASRQLSPTNSNSSQSDSVAEITNFQKQKLRQSTYTQLKLNQTHLSNKPTICECGLDEEPNDEGMVQPNSNLTASVNASSATNGVIFGVMAMNQSMILVFQMILHVITVYYNIPNHDFLRN